MPHLIERPIYKDHPFLPAPTAEEMAAILAVHGEEKLAELMRVRNAAVRREQEDPLRYGWESPTWLLADVFLGFIDWPTFCKRIAQIRDNCWAEDVAESLNEWINDPAMEQAVSEGPYQLGLVMGGNSGGKTEYMTKRAMIHADKFRESDIWVFHQSGLESIKLHHARIWKFMPEKWKNVGKGQVGYVGYKKHTGFSGGKAIGPNGSTIEFRNYEQNVDTIEGGEVGDPHLRRCLGWVTDELVPLDWVKTLRFRLNRRQAVGCCGFTPKYGYSDMVAWFLDGHTTVRSEPGTELRSGAQVPLVRLGAPDDDGVRRKVILYFHTRYTPYPNRKSYPALIASVQGDTDDVRSIRLYGHVEKMSTELFPKADRKVHGFTKRPNESTPYQCIDPTGRGRNWFGLWWDVDPWDRIWVYREWPSPGMDIPGVGKPGVWATAGKNGGEMGPAQKGFGFGLAAYKAEFARLEGWTDARSDKAISEWDPENGATESVYLRYLDKRFGNTAHDRAQGTTTLQDELGELGFWCELITGHGSQDGRSPIDHGIDLINSALDYQPGWEELDTLGQVEKGPKLFIHESCENLWFALRNYTGMGGYKEATKDPIDCLRYILHTNATYVGDLVAASPRGGYGMRASQLPTKAKGKAEFFNQTQNQPRSR